jgi:hypothetical protein
MKPDTLTHGRRPSTIATIVFLLWGLIVWGLQFSFVYVGHTWLCALGWQDEASLILVGVATVLSATLIAPVVFAPARLSRLTGLERQGADARSLHTIARLIGVLSLVAVVWTGAAALIVQACSSLR